MKFEPLRPKLIQAGIHYPVILMDNAKPHHIVTEYLQRRDWDTLDHPPYSLDMNPCDFDAIHRVKLGLKGVVFRAQLCSLLHIIEEYGNLTKMIILLGSIICRINGITLLQAMVVIQYNVKTSLFYLLQFSRNPMKYKRTNFLTDLIYLNIKIF